MAKWYYQKSGVTHGPIDSADLKQLAQSGGLGPDDLLRRDDMQSWTKASKVNGLFPTSSPPATVQSLTASSSPEIPESHVVAPLTPVEVQPSAGGSDQPVATTQSVGSTKKKNESGSFLEGCLGFAALAFGVLFIISCIAINRNHSKIDEANRLWDAGRKDEAVAIYRPLAKEPMQGKYSKHALERLIEYDIEHGATDSAKQLIDYAVEQESKPLEPSISLSSPQGRQMLDEARRRYKAARIIDVFDAIVRKYKASPDKFASRQEREKYNLELDTMQREFFRLPFDPARQRVEARKMIEQFEKEIEGQYTGESYRLLENHMADMYQKMTQ